MKTIKGVLKADGTKVNIKIVGFYSHLTKQTHKTKSCRTKAENKLKKKAEAEQLTALKNKFNTKHQ